MATALVLCCAVAVTGTSNPCLGDERSEAWKAERSGCKRERAGLHEHGSEFLLLLLLLLLLS